MPDFVISLLTTAIAVVSPYVIQYLKDEPWMPLLQRSRPLLNTIVAAALVVGQTLGLTFAFTDGTLTIGGLHPPAMALAAFNWAVQLAIYHLRVRRA